MSVGKARALRRAGTQAERVAVVASARPAARRLQVPPTAFARTLCRRFPVYRAAAGGGSRRRPARGERGERSGAHPLVGNSGNPRGSVLEQRGPGELRRRLQPTPRNIAARKHPLTPALSPKGARELALGLVPGIFRPRPPSRSSPSPPVGERVGVRGCTLRSKHSAFGVIPAPARAPTRPPTSYYRAGWPARAQRP